MTDICQLLSAYENAKDALISRWRDINAIIQGGFAPSKECGDGFQMAVERLQEAYSAIRTAAAEACPETAGEDRSVQVYIELIEQRRKEDARRAQDRRILERFAVVEAAADKYKNALAPFQEEARKMLEQSGELSEEALQGPSRFLSCLELSDLSSPEGEALMEDLAAMYPSTVYHGVHFHKYTLPADDGKEPVRQNDSDRQPDRQTAAEPAPCAQNEDAPKPEDTKPEAPESTAPEASGTAEKDSSQKRRYAALVSATRDIKALPANASAFKREVRSIPYASTILPLFTNTGALMEVQVAAFGVFMGNFTVRGEQLTKTLRASMEKLVNKNLLAAYDLDGMLVYCLTHYCIQCMQKDKVFRDHTLWGMDYGKVFFAGEQKMDPEPLKLFTAYNAALMVYLFWAQESQNLRIYKRLRASIAWRTDHYEMNLRWKGKSLPASLLLSLTAQPLPEGNVMLAWEPVSDVLTDVPTELPKDPPETPPGAVPVNGSVFMPRDDILFRWNGERWVTEQEDDFPDPPADNPPDNSSKAGDSGKASEAESPAADNAPVEDKHAGESPAAEELPPEEEILPAEEALPEEEIPPVEELPPEEEISPAEERLPDRSADAFDNKTVFSEMPPVNENPPAGVLDAEPLFQKPEDLSAYGIYDGLEARALAKNLLKHGLSPSHVRIYQSLVEQLIAENRILADGDKVENSISQAAVLSKALALYHPFYQPDFQRLVLALDSRIEDHRYLGEQILTLFEGDAVSPPVLKLMTLLRALFAPDTAYDHTLRSYARSVFDRYEEHFPGLALLKPLYSLILDLAESSPAGFSTQVLRIFSDNEAEQDLLRQITCDAKKMVREPRVNSGLKAMTPMVARCFGPGSDLRGCMEIIQEDRRSERELVQDVYSGYVGTDGNLSDSLIDRFYEENWQWAIEKIRAPKDIFHYQRAKVVDQIRARLTLMGRWLELTNETSEGDSKWFRAQRNQILQELERVLPLLADCRPYDQAILRAGLFRLRQRLNGQLREDVDDFSDFLRTGVFCLDERGVPCLDSEFPVCRYYEPWRNALLHISADTEGLRSVLERIADPSDPFVYDNLGQAVDICRYLNSHCGEELPVEQYFEDLEATQRSAQEAIGKFMGELESAFAYGRLSEFVKEDLRAAVYAVDQKPSDLLELFEERHNYGCLRALLDALRKIIVEKTAERQMALKADIEDRKKSNANPRLAGVLDAALKKLEEPERNFVVAEEYINRFDAGIAEDMSGAETPNAFLDFIGPAYDELYRLCREHSSASLRSFGGDFVERELRRHGVSSQYQNSALALLKNMPNRPEDAAPAQIMNLMRELGFDVTHAEPGRVNSSGMVRLSVTVRPDAKDKSEYAHPVDIMGTKLRPPVDVVCLFGRMQPNDIVDKVCRLEMNRTALVFLNGPLDLPGRRQIAERFHREMSGRNPFLLIDWVLLLYLALRQKTERLPVLLSCTLPYTSSFQPFVEEGSVSDEMFIGRKRELNKILDPNGPVIIYGGRQLGKSALLERAQNLANHPAKKEFAVLIRAGSMPSPCEEALTAAIIQELDIVGLKVPAASNIQALCQTLRHSYNKGGWVRLLVLIDESDKLLENFHGQSPPYLPVIALSDLKRATGNDFKFVFAGLHDVCAAANDPNTIFGQFGDPLIIKPLSAPEALELLSRPLRYLGFDIESARLEHLLVNTIFYPGIVHYVGHCLVQNLSTSYAKYYSAHDNPPYSLTDKQLGEIMSGSKLNKLISDRIRWTLEVDNRYFMLARCVAYLYHEYPEKMKSGYSVDSIMEYIALLEINCLSSLDRPAILTLLQELVDMGILVRPGEEAFRLRQQRFLDIIGSRENIETDIQSENGGVNHA